jgi:hypothetical protein
MAATNTTTNFGLNLTDFDKIPWGEEQHNNWHIMDALMARFIAVSLVQGAWENALVVAVGDRYIDTDQDLIYEVLVAHTTPSTGTFAAARTANSSQWQAVTVDVANKGTYAQATVYSPNNFVQDGGRFGIVQTDYTSDNTAATTALSYDADVTNGDIITLLDASALIAATHDTNTVATGGTPTATYTAATSKFNFGLVTGATGATGAVGADYTADAELNAIAGLTSAADKLPYFTGSGTAALADITTAGRALIDDAAASNQRTTLGLAIGTNVQAYDAQLADVAGLAVTNGGFIVGDGTNFVLETGATAFSSIKQAASDSVTGVSELATTAETVTGTDTARVVTPAGLHGALAGLTDTTITASDTVVFADATDSNALKEDTVQGILDLAGGGAWNLVGTEEAPGGLGTATLDITGLDSTYDTYCVALSDIVPITDGVQGKLRFGDSGGIDTSGYAYHSTDNTTTSGNYDGQSSTSTDHLRMSVSNVGATAGEGLGGIFFIHNPADGVVKVTVTGMYVGFNVASNASGGFVIGGTNTVITLDRVQFLFSSGNVETGRMTVWGIAHA